MGDETDLTGDVAPDLRRGLRVLADALPALESDPTSSPGGGTTPNASPTACLDDALVRARPGGRVPTSASVGESGLHARRLRLAGAGRRTPEANALRTATATSLARATPGSNSRSC